MRSSSRRSALVRFLTLGLLVLAGATAWARGEIYRLSAPVFVWPTDRATQVGGRFEVRGEADPEVALTLYDETGAHLAEVRSDIDGHWAAMVVRNHGPDRLFARAHVGEVTATSAVDFTILDPDSLEGGGCSSSGASLLTVALVLLMLRRRA